jgi:RNA polymerase sigma factor (sigma-70 family)
MARNPDATAWLNAAGREPMLTPAEELHLGALVRRWQDWEPIPAEAPARVIRQGLRARNRIVAGNLRLVALVVDRFSRPPHVALEDALQAGSLGLIRAAEKFDPQRGYKFSTYSYLWIRQALTCEIGKSGTIRTPANVNAAMRGTRYGSTTPEQLERAALVWHGCLSLDAPPPTTTDDPRPLAEVVEGATLDVAELAQAEQVAEAWRAMEEADEAGTALLQLHHADGANMTELGKLEGCGAVAMRRRLAVATDRLRSLPAVQVAMAG